MTEKDGIDSYVGELSGGGNVLTFDYGAYSNETMPGNQQKRIDTVNRLLAVISTPEPGMKGKYIMLVQVTGRDKLRLEGENITDTAAVMQIFRSVQFREKDFVANRQWAVGNSEEQAPPGKTVFFNNCASCHGIDKDATGPALSGYLSTKGLDSLVNYMIRRQDIIRKKGSNQHEPWCHVDPNLKKPELQKLSLYIQTETNRKVYY